MPTILIDAHHAHPQAPHVRELNLREFPRAHHTSVVFERLDDLGPEGHLVIASEYEPETLRRQIEGWCPDEYRWAWTATGPQVWRAEITRRALISHPGPRSGVGERAPDDNAHGQADHDREIHDRAPSHLASHPPRLGCEQRQRT